MKTPKRASLRGAERRGELWKRTLKLTILDPTPYSRIPSTCASRASLCSVLFWVSGQIADAIQFADGDVRVRFT